MSFIVTLILAITGGTFIYASLFLYETEEARIQNILEEWWFHLEEYKQLSISRHTYFMQRVASLASSGFDTLFGARLYSLRAVTVSGCYSTFAEALSEIVGYFILLQSDHDPQLWFELLHASVTAAAIFLLGLLAILKPRSVSIVAPLALVVALSSFGMLVHDSGSDDARSALTFASQVTTVFFTALVIGIVSDVLFIAFIRWTLRRCTGMDSVMKILGLGLVNILSAVAFVLLPFTIAFAINTPERSAGELGTLALSEMIASTLAMIAAMNLTMLVPALVFACLAGFLLGHRLIWPLVNRPIYALARAGIVKRRMIAFAIGIALLAIAVPLIGRWVHLVLAPLV